MGAEGCLGLHGVRLNRRREVFEPSAGTAEWAQRVVWTVIGFV